MTNQAGIRFEDHAVADGFQVILAERCACCAQVNDRISIAQGRRGLDCAFGGDQREMMNAYATPGRERQERY